MSYHGLSVDDVIRLSALEIRASAQQGIHECVRVKASAEIWLAIKKAETVDDLKSAMLDLHSLVTKDNWP
jgi:hypothetical protein